MHTNLDPDQTNRTVRVSPLRPNHDAMPPTWLETAAYHGMNAPNAAIPYLQPEYSPASITGPFTGEGGIVSLRTMSNHVQVETYQVSARLANAQIQSLDSQYPIDTISMTQNSLVKECLITAEDVLSKKYTEAGQKHEEELLTPWQKWIKRLFPSYNKVAYANTDRELVALILSRGNRIALDTRMGPADWIKVNSKIAEMLCDSKSFIINTNNKKTGRISNIGQLAGLTVYLDEGMPWLDTRILIGRRTQESQSGAHLCDYQHTFSQMNHPESNETHLALKSRWAIDLLGDSAYKNYFTTRVVIGSKPWWVRLLNL